MLENPYHRFKSIDKLVGEVVNKHLPTGDTEAVSRQFDRIKGCWPDCAPDLVSQNIKPVRLDKGILHVETHSPVWANKGRYMMKSILVKLHAFGFVEIKKIRIRVNPKSRAGQ